MKLTKLLFSLAWTALSVWKPPWLIFPARRPMTRAMLRWLPVKAQSLPVMMEK